MIVHIPFGSCAAATSAVCILLSSCQSIPPRPLALTESLEALKSREIAPQPVLEYAQTLAHETGKEAVSFDVSDGLTLSELEAIALHYNAELLVSRLEADGISTVASASGRWEDPEVDLTGGRKREDLAGVERSWISGAALSLTLPLSGRVGAERQALSATHASALLAVAEQEWTTLSQLREAWLNWFASVERTRLLDEHLALLSQFAEVAQALAAAGELDPGSARMFSIELAHKSALRQSAALRDAGQRALLLGLAGLLPDAPVTLTPRWISSDGAGASEVDSEQVALAHPAVTRMTAEYQVAEARLRVELRKQYPDLVLTPTYNKEGGESSITLGLGLVPVPVWNTNKPGIAEAAVQRDIARARAEGKLQQVLSEIANAQAERAGARALREGLMGGAATEADHQMQEAQALLRVGEADMGMVFQALTQAYGIKQELLEAMLEEQRAIARLDSLTSVRPHSSVETGATP